MNTPIRLAAVAVALVLVGAIAYALIRGGSGGAGLNFSGDSSSATAPLAASGPSAPEFTGIVAWENSPPLTIASLRGKVVLVDFWTYSCINCQRTIPFLHQWWNKYKDSGFVIVGVHSPEFDFEKSIPNIQKAIKDYGVAWPVAVDSNMATWNAYSNQYWPAEYLINQSGKIVHTHFGEGEYDVTEKAIQTLLAQGGRTVPTSIASADPGITSDANRQTPETYAGSARGNGSIRLVGGWKEQPEYAELTSTGYAEIQYRARKVFVVASAAGAPVNLRVTLDGHDLTTVKVDHSDLYTVVDLPDFSAHVLRITPDQAGFQLYTFTFGS